MDLDARIADLPALGDAFDAVQMPRLPNLDTLIAELEEAFDAVQMPRSPLVLESFVVGQHDTEPRRYAQCVLELQFTYDNIRRALLHRKKLQLEAAELEKKDEPIASVEADLKQLDIEVQDRAIIGALREFKALYRIWKSFPRQYTRQELDTAEEEYWRKRLTRQAQQSLLAAGRVDVGTQEALRQINLPSLPQFDHEQRYLASGNAKVLIAVPTKEKAVNGLPCLEGLIIPSGMRAKYYNIFGRPAAEAYNDAAMTCLQDQANFVLTVNEDTFPPPDALIRLLKHFQEDDAHVIVAAWYPKREIVLGDDGRPKASKADGKLHEVHIIPMGCTLFPAQVFLAADFPWFVTTDQLTPVSSFSQKAREAGYRLLCDTAIRCNEREEVSK